MEANSKKNLTSLKTVQKKDCAPEYYQIIWVSAGKVSKNLEENDSEYILFLQFPLMIWRCSHILLAQAPRGSRWEQLSQA